jgi:hypothetical protein
MTTSIRRLLPYVVSCLLIVVTATSFVSAQGFTSENTGVKEAAKTAGYDVASVSTCSGQPGGCIPTIIGNVVSGLLGIFGALFLALIMWGGVQWMFAGGSPEKVKKARETITNAVLGMLIVAASYAIVTFVLNTVGGATSGGTAVSEVAAP